MSEAIAARPSDIDHLTWLKYADLAEFSGKKILDLGCGSGYLCEKAMSDGATEAVGIDILPPDTKQALKWKYLNSNLDSKDWHSEIDHRFDLILAFDIIEHLHSPSLFLTSCLNLLNKGGVLFLTTPNQLSWERFCKPNSWSGVQDEQHKILFSKYSLKFLLERVGFKAVTINAPLRSLDFLKRLQPQIGGQIVCKAQK